MRMIVLYPIAAMAVFVAVLMSPSLSNGAVTTRTISLYSEALDGETTYIVALPSTLEEGRNYPVLYVLHGATGSYRDWPEKTTITEELASRDMILVFPDGSEFGWYIDSEIKVENQFESAVTRDVRLDVERRFPARTDRGGRGIAGLSMGGHGALSLAAKNPELYISASSLSGILDIARHAGKWRLDDILGSQPEHVGRWRANSVYHLADRFTTAGIFLLFDTGMADKTGAVEDARKLHERLKALGVKHTYREFSGKHDWVYWREHIGEHIEFHSNAFTEGE